MQKSSQNLTTVSLRVEDIPRFEQAAAHFQYRNLAAFFRDCGLLLIHHYERGDRLLCPLAFEVQKKGAK